VRGWWSGGVRPEKLRLAQRGDEPVPPVSLPAGRATLIGVGHQYSVELAGGGEPSIHAQNAGVGALPGAGDEVCVVWESEHTLVVRKES